MSSSKDIVKVKSKDEPRTDRKYVQTMHLQSMYTYKYFYVYKNFQKSIIRKKSMQQRSAKVLNTLAKEILKDAYSLEEKL